MTHLCDAPGLLPLPDALSKILAQVSPINQSEQIELEQGLGRVLSQDVIATMPVPPKANSAMDGYALRSADLLHDDTLECVGSALAGSPYAAALKPGQCIRIMTGAIIPAGADAVEMQENTQLQGNKVVFAQPLQAGSNIRQAGEDIKQGQVVLAKGTKLKAAHLALVASLGESTVTVCRLLKVGIIATGDELKSPGSSLAPGDIYESNSVALKALLSDYPVEVFDFGIIKDDHTCLTDAFEQAGSLCDLVLSCGGVSVGEADHVKDVLAQLGSINFWKVAIKPGKPFAFGNIKNALFCGLPGNPVSSFVTFEQLVSVLLRQMSGQLPAQPPYFIAKAAAKIRKRPGRADFQRGIYYRDQQGELWVKPKGKQGSGVMSSIANANCYLLLDQQSGDLAIGQEVKIQPFSDCS